MYTLILVSVLAVGTDDGLKEKVKDLGNDNFFVRKETEEYIIKNMGFKFYLKLKKHVDSDPQINRGISEIISQYESRYTCIDLKGYPDYPWIDMLPENYKDRQIIIDKYLVPARQMLGTHGYCWPDYRLATRNLIQERLQSGFYEALSNSRNEKEFQEKMHKLKKSAEEDFDAMIKNMDEYCEKRGMKNPLRQGF